MSEYTKVDSSAMATGIADLKTAQANLRSQLDQLQGELKSSLAQWDGGARETYAKVQAAWDADCDMMAGVIAKVEQVLTGITEGYASTEKKIEGTFGA